MRLRFVESRSGGRRDPNLLRDYRLHAHQPVDGPQTDATNVRDDLSLLYWFGGGGRTAGSFSQVTSPASLNVPVRRSAPLPRQRLLLRGRRVYLPLACCLVSLLPSLSDRSTAAHLPPLNTNAIIVPNRIAPVPFKPPRKSSLTCICLPYTLTNNERRS